MGIIVIGTAFVDIKGFPEGPYLPTGRNMGDVKYVHGGVARNVVEDIANLELRPTYVGKDVLQKLQRHKINTDYVLVRPDGMGLWLAVFDSNGDLAGSISKRPDSYALLELLESKGDEIFRDGDAVVVQVDLHKDIVKKVLELAEKYRIKTYAVVANMSIAAERRDMLQRFDCFICKEQEAELLFLEDYIDKQPEQIQASLADKVLRARIPSMVVTLGEKGSVYADQEGNSGYCPARKVEVKDTTGAGDAFCAGVASGLTYGKTLAEAVEIGTLLSASVIVSSENVCPRFLPEEFGLNYPGEKSENKKA